MDRATSEIPTCQRIETRAAVLTVGILILAPFVAVRFSRVGISVLELMIVLTAILLAIRSRRMPTNGAPIVCIWLACLIGWSILSLATSLGGYASIVQAVDFVFWLMAFCCGSALVGLLPWGRMAICIGAGGGGFLAALMAVREYIFTRDPGWRAFGPFFNPGFLSGYMTLTLPIAVALYLRAKRPAFSLLALICCLLQISALFLSGTRYGIATGGFALIVFFVILFFRLKQSNGLLKILILFILGAATVVISSQPLLTRVGAASTETHSGLFRLYTWHATANMIRDHPLLGTGAGTYEQIFPKYNIAGFTRMAHQDYLQIAAETGLPGLGFLILALACALWASAKATFGEYDKDERLLSAGILAGALGSAARGMLDSDMYVFGIVVTLWFCLGAAVTRRSSGEIHRSACIKIVCIMAILSAPFIASFGGGSLLSTMGDRALSQGDIKGGDYYRLAARIDPLNAFHQMRLGQFCRSWQPNDPGMAISRFRRAIQLEPNRARNYFVLGNTYLGGGDYAAAAREFRNTLKRSPKDPKLILALAQAYELVGKPKPAMDEYRKLLRQEKTPYETIRAVPQVVEPAYAFAHFAVAEDLLKRRRTEEAITHYKLCAVRLERRASFGKLLAALREVGSISREDEERIDSLYREARDRLAEIYSKQGDSRLAREWAEKAEKGIDKRTNR